MIRILLADDHSVMRIGLATLISSERDMRVVGEAGDGQEAVAKARDLRPDVVIMDLQMPKLGGAAATKSIRAELPATRVLVLTSFGASAEMAEAVANGADGALAKDAATDDLISAVRTVAAGGRVLPKRLMRAAQEMTAAPQLTERQVEVLAYVTRGLSNEDIARQFGISVTGVKKHLQVIFEKLGAATRAEAAVIALRRQLLKT